MNGWIRKRYPILLLTAAVAAVGSVGGITAALADVPDSGVINGCYKTSNPAKGALIVIDSSAGQTCPSGTNPLSWNQTGPQGPAGPSTAGAGGLDLVLAQSSGSNPGQATAYCPSDHPYVVSGGFTTPGNGSFAASFPVLGNGSGVGEEPNSGNGWEVQSSTFPNSAPVGAYVVCAK